MFWPIRQILGSMVNGGPQLACSRDLMLKEVDTNQRPRTKRR